MTELPRNSTATRAPSFQGRIDVSQSRGSPSAISIVLFLLPVVGSLLVWFWLIGHENPSVLGSLAVVALLLVGCAAGAVLGGLAEEWRDRRRGYTHFHATTEVTVDVTGLHVEGLGRTPWADVLAFEGIPDSDSALLVHTGNLHKLLLFAPTDQIVPVFQHHMARHAQSQDRGLRDRYATDIASFKAVVFHYPQFQTQMARIYALGSITWLGLVVLGIDYSFLEALAGASIVAAALTGLLRYIPLDRLTHFSRERMGGFELQGDQLRSTDGRWHIDLAKSCILRSHAKGFGYQLNFISILAADDQRLDLLLSEQDLDALTERWTLQRPASIGAD